MKASFRSFKEPVVALLVGPVKLAVLVDDACRLADDAELELELVVLVLVLEGLLEVLVLVRVRVEVVEVVGGVQVVVGVVRVVVVVLPQARHLEQAFYGPQRGYADDRPQLCIGEGICICSLGFESWLPV